jgi:translation initiation factor IF-2
MLDLSPIDIIKELMNNGIMANINQALDYETAAIVAGDLGFEVVESTPVSEAESSEPSRRDLIEAARQDEAKASQRSPVVAVMGHVDHGKTSLLDAIRETNVAEGEAGGITQRIGAYQITKDDKKLTFVDTPGHEAFTAMRARGAQVTDVAVLVVAADDGVMPQTLEAIDHVRAANVPLIVALNKIDKENANPERVKQQLAEADVLIEEWGGDVVCVPVSAKERTGIENLLEMILLVSEVEDLTADPDRPAMGTVLEGELDRSKGVVASLLVQMGTLRLGDVIVAGMTSGRVRAMFDDGGNRIEEAGPSIPVAILGLSKVPEAGEIFKVMESDQAARQEVTDRQQAGEDAASRSSEGLTLDQVYELIQAGEVKELNLIIKADAQGSLQPIVSSLLKLGDETLKARILRQGTGDVSESDIMLAVASRAVVIAFHVGVDTAARQMADSNKIDVRSYDVIYRLVDDIDRALKGMLEPVYEDVVIGKAKIQATFKVRRQGVVAGVMVTEGKVTRDALARLLRSDEVIYEGKVASLRRFTEDVGEVAAGFECGVGLEGFAKFEEDDIIEFYKKERVS